MDRTRSRFAQLPAITLLLIALGATLPLSRVRGTIGESETVVSAAPHIAVSSPMDAPLMTASVSETRSGIPATDVPVAQIVPAPEGVQSVSFTVAPATARGAVLLASGRYTVSGHTIVVNTLQADTAQMEQSLPRDARAVTLADGTMAWVTTGLSDALPNRVALLRGGYAVTLAGDLPLDTLTALAANVVIRW